MVAGDRIVWKVREVVEGEYGEFLFLAAGTLARFAGLSCSA